MHPFTFHTVLQLYQLIWSTATPLLLCSRRLREGYAERTLRRQSPGADLWIQAASVGEAYLALELLKNLECPEPLTVLVTTNTSQGREVIEKSEQIGKSDTRNLTLNTAYFPFDNPALMKKAVSALKPALVLLLESELWPGLLMACRNEGIKVMVVNGRMSRKSLKRYLLLPSFWRYFRPDKVLAMSEDDAGRFRDLFGPEVVDIMPNMKFDRINAHDPLPGGGNPLAGLLPPPVNGRESGPLFAVLGSIRQEEEKEVLAMIADLFSRKPETVVGLFPRHMHRIRAWQKKLDEISIDWTLRSRLTEPAASGTVILWDSMGELYQAYSLARAAFVGGSLVPLGGQNFLEPLTCGIKPVIGPHWSNFQWVGRRIINQGLVHEAKDRQECLAFLLQELDQPPDREKNRKKALDYIEKRKGGTRKAIDNITPLLFNKT